MYLLFYDFKFMLRESGRLLFFYEYKFFLSEGVIIFSSENFFIIDYFDMLKESFYIG